MGFGDHAARRHDLLTLFPMTVTSCPERGDGDRPLVWSLAQRPITEALQGLCFSAHSVQPPIDEHFPPILLPIEPDPHVPGPSAPAV